MKAMLAATIDDIKQLDGHYPFLASPKLDGVRAMVVDGVLYSRNMKPIRNKWVQKCLPLHKMNGWDGELIVGTASAVDVFTKTTSGVMSIEGTPDFVFYVFDHKPHGAVPFTDRFNGLRANVRDMAHKHIKIVPHVKVGDSFEVLEYERSMLAKGFEGVMLRDPHGAYKEGRSTMRERGLMKLKRFEDSEAVVLGVVEQMENTNESTKDELGRSKRSSAKAGKMPKGTLGALHVRDSYSGIEFEIGTGFDDTTRQQIWDNAANKRTTIIGKLVKYKFQPAGVKEKPRFPVYLGLRLD